MENLVSLERKVDGLILEVGRQGSRIENIEGELSRQGVLGEERDSKLDLVLDAVLRINERLTDNDWVGASVKDHEFRIRALEIKVAQKA